MGPVMICAGVVFVLIGAVMLISDGGFRPREDDEAAITDNEARAADETLPPIFANAATASRRGYSYTQSGAPAPPAEKRNTPPPTIQRQDNSMNAQFFNAKLGQTITFNHPQRGGVTGKILGSITYTELWQRVNKASEPWVPTGNSFVAHWLGSQLLYEWQSRLYVLDEYQPLSDQDIQQSFLPYAKQFAQSNQTAQISFAWPPASWTIADIGKFRVARAEGEGLRLNAGAEGRFIHCNGADKRALVVEDYQSGQGGQDTAWIGYQLTWDDVTKIG
jgi:hypothetical protein